MGTIEVKSSSDVENGETSPIGKCIRHEALMHSYASNTQSGNVNTQHHTVNTHKDGGNIHRGGSNTHSRYAKEQRDERNNQRIYGN